MGAVAHRRLALTPHALVVAATLLAAVPAGALIAARPTLGVGLLAAAIFVPLAIINPQLALAGWITTLFISGIPGTRGAGSNYALLVVFVVWIGALAGGNTAARELLHRHARLVAAVLGFLAWAAVTLLWAPEMTPAVSSVLLRMAIAAVAFLMVATLVRRPEHVRYVAAAFVAGTALSILAGIAGGGLGSGADSAVTDAGRLQGGTHDPNYLAAAIVPAMMMAAGLAARPGRPLLRLGLGAVMALLALGLAATESRGGLLAAAVVLVGAFALWRGRRTVIALFTVVLVVVAGLWFSASPAAWERITNVGDGGSGRSDTWQVAWRVVEAHPVAGAGLAQFPAVSPDFVDRPGALPSIDLLIRERIVVHNVYLQLWAETGIVGLLLFLAVVWGALAACWRAARRFDAAGDASMTALSWATLLATLGALTASVFLSNVDDRRLWVLLGLGPALLLIARRADATRAA